ncbi:MAG: glycosyltransferase family 2 protein, partial [Planctomycetia bacterium]
MLMNSSMPEISVVLPAHNEAENLKPLVDEIVDALSKTDLGFEIVVVDDASTDGTVEALQKMAETHPSLVVFRMCRQSGQSAALAAGFDQARGDVVVTMDADRQNDPADIPSMLEALVDVDVVIGWRKNRRDPWNKRYISKFANGVRNWLTKETVRDTGCGLKVFRRESLQKIHRFDGMHRFFPTLVKMHGFRVAEVAVNHRPRDKG